MRPPKKTADEACRADCPDPARLIQIGRYRKRDRKATLERGSQSGVVLADWAHHRDARRLSSHPYAPRPVAHRPSNGLTGRVLMAEGDPSQGVSPSLLDARCDAASQVPVPTLGFTARVRSRVGKLPASAFSFVMATGITADAIGRLGWTGPATALAWVAMAGLVALCATLAWQAAIAPRYIVRQAQDPSQAFGYLTIVAAFNVVAVQAMALGLHDLAWTLALAGLVAWAVLGYGIPSVLILHRADRPAVESADGSWFLWVVATQSVATTIGNITGTTRALAVISVAFWGVGVMLYIVLTTLVTIRLLGRLASPSTLSPPYWIYMGATAITVLSGSVILGSAAHAPVIAEFRPVVAGLTFMLWAFGLWWVPLLLIFGVWRHAVHRVPLRYDTALWSIVFPLGMVAAASIRFGTVQDLGFMDAIGGVAAVIAFAAWVAVAVAGLWAAASWLRRDSRGQ